MKRPFFRLLGVTVATLTLFASTLLGQESTTKTSLKFVPSNAAAFVYLDVIGLTKTPDFALPSQLFAGIRTEADQEFLRHTGLRITDLRDATYVVPDLVSMLDSPSEFGLGLFTFAQPLERKLIEDSLPSSWETTETDGRKIYVDRASGLAIFLASPNTVSLGTEKGVRWFFNNRRNLSDSGIQPLLSKTFGQITMGVNATTIPKQFKSFVPPEASPLADIETAVIGFDFSNGIATKAEFKFPSSEEASKATEFAKARIMDAKGMLSELEYQNVSILKSGTPDLETAMTPLGFLAMTRFGQKALDETNLNQSGDTVHAGISIEGFNGQFVCVTAFSAITAIGSIAESDFQSISDELDGSTSKPTLSTEPSD
ncbi:MAG: hypothetical protein AB8B55_15350 [Mariniblastus sp.]